MVVQAFIPKPAVEALDERILRRFARLDQLELHAVLVGPLVQCLAGEFRPLVSPDRLGIAPETRRLIEHPGHVMSRYSEIDGEINGLLAEVIDDSQYLDSAAISQCVTDKIHRPDLVRHRRQFQHLPLNGHPMSPLAAPNRQAGIAVEAIDTLVIGQDPLTANQGMQTAIAEPAAFAGQFNQPCLQLLVLWLHFRFVVQDRAR